MIDLRSDTVTRPTEAMRAAMARADVGDDVWRDDPTVVAFEAEVAERAGMAAGLFVPSGTQGNLTALLAHCQRGEAFIAGQSSHIYRDEGGGAAALGSIQAQPIAHQVDGTLDLGAIEGAIVGEDIHHTRTRLLALENTYNGKVMPAAWQADATALARRHGLATHLDGARLFNASVATGRSLAALCKGFDSVSLCFSKGLGAPVGSVLIGDAGFIQRARRWRKTLGGGMRQVGILAAGCRHALEHHVERLAEDHHSARRLSEGLAGIDEVEVKACDTNMVFIALPRDHCQALEAFMASRGILLAAGPRTRLVTHLDVGEDDIESVVAAFKTYFSQV
ncbi:low-specificity L-threonine aldolase [Halomonas urumqiensis]|uniref:Low-specificity L-threonine aldolase n=2 Tax=Halomonas urumqiensis TaxID=1684789 RepID=A0A2N7UMW3_9GAMM|nr:low-specificity L-threonine aldolase [Halomonas urumqiensis]PMR81783.1 low-specificity L-threonine aldolase [Halomonas urumqiensis]PTB02437.1 low-specificity L-threonine aldolase [Halomonas urumqiensis]